MIEVLGLPKRFARLVSEQLSIENHKVSQLSGKQVKTFAEALTKAHFSIDKLVGYNVAMVTTGGVDLYSINLKTMESKDYEGLYVIGEALDIDGDTGGYNLQFAYSSASVAAESIIGKNSLNVI
jgi:predicted flavoprotein YhiN